MLNFREILTAWSYLFIVLIMSILIYFGTEKTEL